MNTQVMTNTYTLGSQDFSVSASSIVMAANNLPVGSLQMLNQVEQAFRVNTYTAGDQSRPTITALTDGGWLVTWTSDGQDNSDFIVPSGQRFGVYGQRYDSTGAAQGSEFQINTYTINNQ